MSKIVRGTVVTICATAAMLASGAGVAGAAPFKEVLSSHFGGLGGQPGKFFGPTDIAAAANGNFYVADRNNRRIQEFTPTGEFVLTFGKGVNRATGGDICTEEEVVSSGGAVQCGAGTEGGGAGEFVEPTSVTVDRSTHRVYVVDSRAWRLDEFAEEGRFVATFGKGVNLHTGESHCTAQEIEESGGVVQCGAGTEGAPNSSDPDTFRFRGTATNVLASDSKGTVYVATEGRIQMLKEDGQSAGSIPTSEVVTALAVEEEGAVDFVEGETNVIRRFDHTGAELAPIVTIPRGLTLEAGGQASYGGEIVFSFGVRGLATNSVGQLAIEEYVSLHVDEAILFGSLVEAGTGNSVTEFSIEARNSGGIAFAPGNDLYVPLSQNQEVAIYSALPVAELTTENSGCDGVDGEHDTDVTLVCTLRGFVNTEGVSETEVWFEWGLTAGLPELTPVQPVPTSGQVEDVVHGISPHASLFSRLAGTDQNVRAPEQLRAHAEATLTPIVAPKVIGTPGVSYVKSSSAVISGELNPEGAATKYAFQYAPQSKCEHLAGCESTQTTANRQSAIYGRVGVTEELDGLQPATHYRYRLVANNRQIANGKEEGGEAAEEAEGTFDTSPGPIVTAIVGGALPIGPSSATISGTVMPDGESATYAFEVGVYRGGDTQYGVASIGSVGGGTDAAQESATLVGLTPNTTYAFRIAARGGHSSYVSQTAFFTTLEAPLALAGLPSLPLLAPPPIKFPKTQPSKSACKHGFVRDKKNRCVKSKKAPRKKRKKTPRKK